MVVARRRADGAALFVYAVKRRRWRRRTNVVASRYAPASAPTHRRRRQPRSPGLTKHAIHSHLRLHEISKRSCRDMARVTGIISLRSTLRHAYFVQ